MTTTIDRRDYEGHRRASTRRQRQDDRPAPGPEEMRGTVAGTFRTDDMALATLLGMQGYNTSNLIRRRQDSSLAEWHFERDNQLDEIVREYRSGRYLVDPARFIRSLSLVRRQLHSFRDHCLGA